MGQKRGENTGNSASYSPFLRLKDGGKKNRRLISPSTGTMACITEMKESKGRNEKPLLDDQTPRPGGLKATGERNR